VASGLPNQCNASPGVEKEGGRGTGTRFRVGRYGEVGEEASRLEGQGRAGGDPNPIAGGRKPPVAAERAAAVEAEG